MRGKSGTPDRSDNLGNIPLPHNFRKGTVLRRERAANFLLRNAQTLRDAHSCCRVQPGGAGALPHVRVPLLSPRILLDCSSLHNICFSAGECPSSGQNWLFAYPCCSLSSSVASFSNSTSECSNTSSALDTTPGSRRSTPAFARTSSGGLEPPAFRNAKYCSCLFFPPFNKPSARAVAAEKPVAYWYT